MSDKKTKKQAKKRRGRNTLTFYEKIAVIRHHEANQMSRNSLARMFQCCTTQIRRILEQRDEIMHQWEVMSEKDASAIVDEMSRKRREFEMKAMAFILHQWVERCRYLQLNMIINDDTLKIVGLKMATVLNVPSFRPSARWIEKFRQKFKYKGVNLSKPSSVEDPQGTLSVEDIIIEYKHYLPSFMQQEIMNITSSSAVQDLEAEKEEEIPTLIVVNTEEHPQVTDATEITDIEDHISIHDYSITVPSTNKITTEDVLQYLAAVQGFTLMNADLRATAMIRQLKDHFKENYKLQTDDIIILE